MGAVREIKKFLGGYPGGWKAYARGFQGERTPPFEQPSDPDDRRSLIPAGGLKEYWYPALPASAIGKKKPVAVRLLDTDITLFRDQAGRIQALWDYCPHRGVYLSWGDCFYNGFLTCPYHGATFNGDGECVEFLTEGPDSKMVGRLQAKRFPTRTLKGIVWVWMGEEAPAPIEEDVPPEFFQAGTLTQYAVRYWDCNWMVALENTGDSHNMFYVHRNSFRMLKSRLGGRPRTPVGLRVKIVNGKSVQRLREGSGEGPEGYYKVDGKLPYQLYHPRVNGYWPKHRYRLLWTWFWEKFEERKKQQPRFSNPPEWEGQHLPGMVRNNHHTHMYTRFTVPVSKDLTRVFYFFTSRPQTKLGVFWDRLSYTFFLNWMIHFNFSDQDYDAMRSARYQHPEYLSSTDNPVVALRRMVTENARGVQRRLEVKELTTAERLVAEADALLGARPDPSTFSAGDPSKQPVAGDD